ncbi:MAG TPA: EamA family transporter [Clostridiales bacterium]|nr:EamA family transporter [Clostridiales bacterium]
MNKDNFKSYVALIGSMLIFGTLGVVRRYVPLSSAMLALCRGALGSVFLLIFVLVRGGKLKLPERKTTLWLVLTGAVMGLNWMLLFEAYNYTTVAAATMCYYMQPTIVILLSPLVFRERLSGRKLACAAAAIVGMLFVSGVLSGGIGQVRDIRGIAFGLGAAALYAAVIILNKKVVVEDIYAKTVIQLAGAALVMIPYVLLTEGVPELTLTAADIGMVLLVGIVHTGITYALYFGSMQRLKAQTVAVMSYIDPVFALLLSAAVLHERLTPLGIVGAVLIIGSAVISETAKE